MFWPVPTRWLPEPWHVWCRSEARGASSRPIWSSSICPAPATPTQCVMRLLSASSRAVGEALLLEAEDSRLHMKAQCFQWLSSLKKL